MPRPASYPTLYDDLKAVSIADLKRSGYLRPGVRSGTLRWQLQGNSTGEVSIGVSINELEGTGYLVFSYGYNAWESYRYHIRMQAMPSNLGIGQRWYFICSRTGRRCTKLYLANGYFQHRSGIPGAMYQSQVESKFQRSLSRMHRLNRYCHQPYRKKHYQGKPTRYLFRLLVAAMEERRLLSGIYQKVCC